MKTWQPNSWETKPYLQKVNYPEVDNAKKIVEQLQTLPPLVTNLEVDVLKKTISRSSRRQTFFLTRRRLRRKFWRLPN